MQDGPLPVTQVPEFAPSFDSAAYAANVMRIGDTTGEVAKLTDQQLEAEASFRNRAYVAWPKFPDHPAAQGLAALARRERGEIIDVARVRGLSWVGKLLEMHRDDWGGREAQVAARLRGRDFAGCVFELEASFFLRKQGHRSVWMWPTRPDDGDVLVNGSVYAECLCTSPTVRIPHTLGAQVGSALLAAMEKRGRDLHVEITVTSSLVAGDLPAIISELHTRIEEGRTDDGPLALPGYSARIEDLAPGGVQPSIEEIDAFVARHASLKSKWGHVGRDKEGHPAHPRLVSIVSTSSDEALAGTARAAARKHRQIKGGRANIVCVKFGLPVPIEQAANVAVRYAVRQIVLSALDKARAHRVSGALLFFEVGILFPHPSQGIIDPETDPPGPAWVVLPIENPGASEPLPDGL